MEIWASRRVNSYVSWSSECPLHAIHPCPAVECEGVGTSGTAAPLRPLIWLAVGALKTKWEASEC